LESNPHDLVHVYVGSAPDPSSPIYGLMADPGIAALDPIFYLHHANIDRMWAVWNASGHANPTDKKWLDGPSTRRFAMPGPGTAPWYYTPDQVDSLGKLDYTYEDLAAQPAPLTTALAQRLAFLGAPSPSPVAAPQALAAPQASTTQAQLLGANAAPLRIQGRVSHTSIKLDPGENANLIRSFAAPSVAAVPDRVYLKLENVRGTTDASVLGVYLNLPENARPGDNRKLLAGHVALFGLRRASVKDGEHGGEGLTFLLDVTRIIDGLHLSNTLDAISALVSIVPSRALPDKADITVGRISLYRQPN
jgi:tyrosinase